MITNEEKEDYNDTNFTIQQAIEVCNEFAKETNMFVGDPHAAKIAEWLQELAAFKDETYISEEFLIRNGFEKRQFDYLYCDDCVEISAQEIDSEAGVWRIEVGYLDGGYPQTLDICTVGQLRMFLAIEGLNNIVEQLK